MATDWPRVLTEQGAVLDEASGQVRHFGDPRSELAAALERCVLADRSRAGRLLGTGPDLLGLLNRLSTADVGTLAPGQGAHAALLTAKGRIVERLFVYNLGEPGVLLLSGPRGAAPARQHIDRFTVTENTGLCDAGKRWVQLAISGPGARAALAAAGCETAEGIGGAASTLAGRTVWVLGGDGLSPQGATILTEPGDAAVVWSALVEAVAAGGGRAAGTEAWEARRILLGLPESGAELTEDHNPLEAGLWDAVSFDKGCYIGQEVVARLRTYDKVSRDLRGLAFASGLAAPEPGATLYRGELAVGEITSSAVPPGVTAPVALGFVKRRSVETGMRLRVGDPGSGIEAEVVELPFAPLVGE